MLSNVNKFKRRTVIASALFSLLLVSNELIAGHALPEFTANYAIEKYNIKLAEAHYKLRHTESGYKFTHHTELYGVASMFANDSVKAESIIDKVGNYLLLKKHQYIQTGKEKNRNEDYSIQWHLDKNTLEGTITGVARNKKVSLKTNSEVWEALSFQIPLMLEADKNIKEYPYQALLKGKIKTYNFVLTSIQTVSFAGKDYQALQLVRKNPKKKRALHIWLVPELNNIPIFIENYRKGKLHSKMILESVQFNSDKMLTSQLTENNTEDNNDF